MTLEQLCKKDVIQSVSGENLGRADDLSFDPATGSVQALILHGRPRLFGLLGREEDLSIPWEKIGTIGADVIMTTCQTDSERRPRRKWTLF